MVLTPWDWLAHYVGMHPGLAAAEEFLRGGKWRERPAGRIEIDGERLYAVVVREDGRGQARARLEAHRRYVDVQFQVAGTDEIGWRDVRTCEALTPYDAGKDVCFSSETPASWITVPPGVAAVFFPEDAHAPLAGMGPLHKVVVKLAAEWA